MLYAKKTWLHRARGACGVDSDTDGSLYFSMPQPYRNDIRRSMRPFSFVIHMLRLKKNCPSKTSIGQYMCMGVSPKTARRYGPTPQLYQPKTPTVLTTIDATPSLHNVSSQLLIPNTRSTQFTPTILTSSSAPSRTPSTSSPCPHH